jgi:hypothetical protein
MRQVLRNRPQAEGETRCLMPVIVTLSRGSMLTPNA